MGNEISEEEFRKAKEVVTLYKQQETAKLVTDYTCICCNENKITAINPKNVDLKNQQSAMWNNGTVFRISCGYGSKHDLSQFYAAICDDCIDKKLENNIIKRIRK